MAEERASESNLLVVTGAGGMGQAVVRRLGPGRPTLLADVSADALDRTIAGLRDEGLEVDGVVLDVGDAASIDALAAAARDRGGFRHLVHTAGVSPSQATSEQIMRVDVLGTAMLLDAFGRDVRPGCVGVFIASMAGAMLPVPDDVQAALSTVPTAELAALPALDPAALDPGIAYATAKRANQLRVRAAAVPWGRLGGRVASISPGVIQTPMGREELASEVGDVMRQMVEGSPVGRYGTPWDIAAAVAFLVGPDASFITGVDLLVDGGVVASILSPPPA
jgi:NAD(P)-dependent dehydrogenase (short-subunit alcohol dehydrogenase family)